MRRSHWLFIAGLSVTLIAGVSLILRIFSTAPADTTMRIRAVTARGLDEDFAPVEPATVFRPDDGFFLSVVVENVTSPRIISARWRFRDTVITTQDQVVGGAGAGYTIGFELQRTDEVWPVGDYSADILIGGDLVGIAHFSVAAEDG